MSRALFIATLFSSLNIGLKDVFVKVAVGKEMLVSSQVSIQAFDLELFVFDFGKYLTDAQVRNRLGSFLEGATQDELAPLIGNDKLAGIVFVKRDWPAIKERLEAANGVF